MYLINASIAGEARLLGSATIKTLGGSFTLGEDSEDDEDDFNADWMAFRQAASSLGDI